MIVPSSITASTSPLNCVTYPISTNYQCSFCPFKEKENFIAGDFTETYLFKDFNLPCTGNKEY